jgi:hypothetical protein
MTGEVRAGVAVLALVDGETIRTSRDPHAEAGVFAFFCGG